MPNKYTRKAVHARGAWTQENLTQAIRIVVNENMSIRRASAEFNIPRKTLERRIKTGNSEKGNMGPSCTFGKENEDRLSRHILTMQKRGFPLTRDDLRTIAYHFAQQLNIKHKFNNETQKAGYDWLSLFLSRHPEITIRKSEGVSIARATAMSRKEVDDYFNLLETTLEENSLFDKPANVFNIDETGLQLNSRPGEVLAKKGSKAVSTVTSTERGETITLVACCNAEGNFLPPAIIMKGKNKKKEWEDDLPPGSVLFMSQKSAYINKTIFLQWMREHFVPRKPLGKVLLILDGHASHVNSVEMLEFAESNDIIILCLPSHTTHYLQPLDRSFFKSLKAHFYESCRLWLRNHAGRRITRYQFGELLSASWGKAASTQNGSSGFKATGILPFNRHIIPDYAFCIEECSSRKITHSSPQKQSEAAKQSVGGSDEQPSTSTNQSDKFTPSKILSDLSPSVPEKITSLRKRAKQIAAVLTSPEHLSSCREKEKKTREKEKKAEEKEKKGEESEKNARENQNKTLVVGNKKNKIKKKKKNEYSSSEDESDVEMNLEGDESESEDFDENLCIGCGEDYRHTKKKADWIKCINCLLWLHETCTTYGDFCQNCGKLDRKSKIGKNKI